MFFPEINPFGQLCGDIAGMIIVIVPWNLGGEAFNAFCSQMRPTSVEFPQPPVIRWAEVCSQEVTLRMPEGPFLVTPHVNIVPLCFTLAFSKHFPHYLGGGRAGVLPVILRKIRLPEILSHLSRDSLARTKSP